MDQNDQNQSTGGMGSTTTGMPASTPDPVAPAANMPQDQPATDQPTSSPSSAPAPMGQPAGQPATGGMEEVDDTTQPATSGGVAPVGPVSESGTGTDETSGGTTPPPSMPAA